MSLQLYLDDCAYSRTLLTLLQAAGHTVRVPADAGLSKQDDHIHLAYAIQNDLILVTKNPGDFLALHQGNSNHPGIILIYQDNNPDRDMSYAEIVEAINTLEHTYAQSGSSLAGAVHILNHWRGASPGSSP